MLLMSYTLRAIVLSYEKEGFRAIQEIENLFHSPILRDPKNLWTFIAMAALLVFPAFSYWIEILAASNANRVLVSLFKI